MAVKRGHKTKPVPLPEVVARAVGSFQWVCPNCHYIYGSHKVSWRECAFKCFNRTCSRRFRLGIGFTSQLGGVLPPFNAIYAGPFNDYNANKLENMPEGTPCIARFIGRIDWICPDCRTPQGTVLDWDLCSTVCLKCEKRWYIRLIIWKANKFFYISTPYDWTPITRQWGHPDRVRIYDQKVPVLRTDVKEIGKIE